MLVFSRAQEMLDFIKPYDYERTLKRDFYSWMENDLWDWVRQSRHFDNTYIRNLITDGDNDYRAIEERKEILGNNYFSVNPELYWEFLIEKRIISLPKFWQDEYHLTLSRAVELLTPVQPPSGIVFGLGNSYNNERYQMAMKLLQKKLGGEANGVYDEDMAEWLYIKGRTFIPREEGYLVHEVDPDYLFKDWKPMVLGVDRLLWRMFGLNPDDLKPDGIGGEFAEGEEQHWLGATAEGAGYAGAPFDAMERTVAEGHLNPVLPTSELVKDAKGTAKTFTKKLDGIDIVFSMSEPLVRDLENGTVSMDTLEDVVVEGVKTSTSQVVGNVAVTCTLKLFFAGFTGGWYFIAATALNVAYGILLDLVMDYLQTDFMDDAMHFDEWQQVFHVRDMEAGIRMD